MRPGDPEDASACARILNAWIDTTDWMPRCHSPENVERHYRDAVLAKCDVTVAEREGRVVGFIGIDPPDAHITTFYVDGQTRGEGIGKDLLDMAKGRWPSGLDLWTFVANSEARRFYVREGFTEIQRTDGDNEECLPDILYRWAPE